MSNEINQVKKVRFYPSSILNHYVTKGYTPVPYGTNAIPYPSIVGSSTVNGSSFSPSSLRALVGMHPYKEHSLAVSVTSSSESINFYYPLGNINEDNFNCNYFALLGSNLGTLNGKMRLYAHNYSNGSDTLLSVEPILNCQIINTNEITPTFNTAYWTDTVGESPSMPSNGTVMVKIDDSPLNQTANVGGGLRIEIVPEAGGNNKFLANFFRLGGFSWGRYYDMPFSPDLSYSINYSFEGIDVKRTKSGSDTIYARYHKRPLFSERYVPFVGHKIEDYETTPIYQIGRRTFKLNYSSFKSGYTNTYDEETGFLFPKTTWNMDEAHYSNDFYFRVMHQTLGGKLPCIFELDNSTQTDDDNTANNSYWPYGEHNESNFIIGRIDNKNTSFKHKSHKHYNFSISIQETW
tara:strand:- start:287 stop:1504 length:1218 start_codon:yes stop_codon:yes gene_type:complete